MIEFITIIILLIAILFYFYILKKNSKNNGYSVIFNLISREYKMWYSKKYYGYVINRNNVSIFEIDKAIFDLKNMLYHKGIDKDNLIEYEKFLSSLPNKEYGIKGILITVLGYLGTNSLVEKLSPYFIKLFKDNIYSKNEKLGIFLFFVIIVIFFYLLIRVTYLVVNVDNIHRNSQKYFVIKRLITIWDYSINKSIDNIEEARTHLYKSTTVFTGINNSKSNFELEFSESIGHTPKYYFAYLSKFNVLKYVKIKDVRKFIYGILPSLFFMLLIFLTNYFFYIFYIINPNKSILLNLLLVFIGILYFILMIFYFIFYCSQLDRLEFIENKIKSTISKKYEYVITKRDISKIRTKFNICVQIVFLICICKLGKIYMGCYGLFSFLLVLLIIILGIFIKVEKI